MGRLQRKKTIKKKKKKILTEDQRDQLVAESGKNNHIPTTFRASTKGPGDLVAKRFNPPQLKKPKFIDDSIQFLREVKIELKKVTWPPRKQAIGSTSVVIILVFVFAIYFGIVDSGLSALVRFIY